MNAALNTAAFRALRDELVPHGFTLESVRSDISRIRRVIPGGSTLPEYVGLVRVDRVAKVASRRIKAHYVLYNDSGIVVKSESPLAIRFHLDGSLSPKGGLR